MREPNLVVKNILILNILFFVAKVIAQSQGIDFDETLAMHFPTSDLFKPWQIITYMFVHANLQHIFGNMLAVYFFGNMLEEVWGPKRFLNFYLITGISALIGFYGIEYYQIAPHLNALKDSGFNFAWLDVESLKHADPRIIAQANEWVTNHSDLMFHIRYVNEFESSPLMGASGSVFGILGAAAFLFPNTQVMLLFPPIPMKIKWLAIGYAAYELYRGVVSNPEDPVAHFAHLGGMLAGLILVKFVYKHRSSFY